jgi:hypothetical protein
MMIAAGIQPQLSHSAISAPRAPNETEAAYVELRILNFSLLTYTL